MTYVFLLVLALVVAVIWVSLAGRQDQRRKVGPGAGARPAVTGAPRDVEFAAEVAPPVAGPEDEPPDFPVEQPDLEDDLTDVPNGAMPANQTITFDQDFETGEELISFQPDPQGDWSALLEQGELPSHYATDLVTALVRNPRSLYVYWERGGGGEERLKEMLGDGAYQQTIPCLRLFEIEGGGSRTIDLAERDDHWFINDLAPGRKYVVSFERRSPDGRCYLVALSSPVQTPCEGAAGLYAGLPTSPSSPWR